MDASKTHFGFTNIGSKTHIFRVIAKRNFKFWFGSPCKCFHPLISDFTTIGVKIMVNVSAWGKQTHCLSNCHLPIVLKRITLVDRYSVHKNIYRLSTSIFRSGASMCLSFSSYSRVSNRSGSTLIYLQKKIPPPSPYLIPHSYRVTKIKISYFKWLHL